MKEIRIFKYHLIILLGFFFLLLSCGKENTIISSNLIAKGCIPEKITWEYDRGSKYELKYIYMDNKLVHNELLIDEKQERIQNPSFGYFEELLVQSHSTDGKYEDYFYNDQSQVTSTWSYFNTIGGDANSGFVINRTYEYEGEKLIQIKNVTNSEVSNLSYYPNSNNIDSIKTYNSKTELIRLEVFEYSAFQNPFKNLKLPIRFTDHKTELWTPENYFKKRQEFTFGESPSFVILTYDSEYNTFGYPEKININVFFSDTGSILDTISTEVKYTIDYINCE